MTVYFVKNTVKIDIKKSLRCVLRRQLVRLYNFYCDIFTFKDLFFNAFLKLPDIFFENKAFCFYIYFVKISCMVDRNSGNIRSFKQILHILVQLKCRENFLKCLCQNYSPQWSSSYFNAPKSSLSGTFLNTSPCFMIRPSPIPPATPRSASFASPGPFTTQPMTATFMSRS